MPPSRKPGGIVENADRRGTGAQLEVTPEELKEHLAIIGLTATRTVAEQLADADAVDRKGFDAVLQEPAIEAEHWRRALRRLGAPIDSAR